MAIMPPETDIRQSTANTSTWVGVADSNNVLTILPIQGVMTDPVNPLIGYAAMGGFNAYNPTTQGIRAADNL